MAEKAEKYMSDDLRTRIAAALKAEDEKPHVCPFGEPTMASYDRLADAVIVALNRDYIIVEPGTALAQKIVEWQWETANDGFR